MLKRRHPSHGTSCHHTDGPIIFLTVCTKGRKPWLTTDKNHQLLRRTWQQADAWLVGRYIVMPDHLHLFAAPGLRSVPFDNWVRYWKSQFTKAHRVSGHRWQTDHWDTRLRSWESYDDKWLYVRNNAVRHGLVENADDWLYQGELNELRWD